MLKSMKYKLWILLLLLIKSLSAFTQTGEIIGKLYLQDIENKNVVSENTFAILKSKTINDSVKIDQNLSFQFKNLPSDTFLVSVSRRSFPYSIRYIVHVNEGESKHLNVPFSSTCPFDKSKSGICPVCQKKDEVIPIHYGLIVEQVDKNKKPNKRKYYPGGCVVSDCQAIWFCERDKKEF